MDRIITDVKEINEKPELYQMNNAPVNASLEKYILGGKKCTMDDRLYNAFSASTRKTGHLTDTFSVILKVLGILTIALVLIPIIGAVVLVIQMVLDPDNSYPPALIIPVLLTASTIAAGLVLLKVSSKMDEQRRIYDEALNTVQPRFTECYMYKRRQMLRYAYDSGDSTDYKYYIDLRDFYVELPNPSEKWGRAEYAYAVIININGKNMFFLFNDAE